MPRFYIAHTPIINTRMNLPDTAAHHAARVLRLNAGDVVVLFDGSGGEWVSTISRIDKRDVEVEVTAHLAISRESPLTVTLVQGISSGDRMDYTLQKAVELGVSRIQPLACARSVVKLTGERADKRRGHWQNLVIAACEQCGRNVVPEVAAVDTLQGWLANSPAQPLRIMFSPDADASLHTLAKPETGLEILAGPEGGFSPDEYRAALAAGFVPVRLGPRVLRTETAAVAALSAMQVLWGDF
jgi:16S rRNA (uracil1498-N3)-methyltransferase